MSEDVKQPGPLPWNIFYVYGGFTIEDANGTEMNDDDAVAWINASETRIAQARAKGYAEGVEAAAKEVDGLRFAYAYAGMSAEGERVTEVAARIRALTAPSGKEGT